MPDRQKSSTKSNETRLGLVMYGGVALAIYINGVAREFFRAVRGNGVYKWLKALTDSDIVVDIISGTSAGGINGIMLAYALANQKEFGDAASLWRRDGDIRSLLRSPGGDDGAPSLLDSEGFYQPRLEEAFHMMPDYQPRDLHELEFNSPVLELDLFVTGTDVDGRIATVFDDAGHPIDVKDHRSVFLLKHRDDRKEPFKPAPVTYQALGKLARITSCFPAAFSPVSVTCPITEEEKQREPVDARLQEWGHLGKEATFLDGGVIDNKPFTYTLQEIFGRATVRRVERKLFYIEPDPESFRRPERASQPNVLQAVLAALIGIPGYESISEDLKLLASHNRKLNRYNRLLQAAKQHHREQAPAGPRRGLNEVYQRSRLISISDRVVEGLLREQSRNLHLADPEQRRIGSALFAQFDKFQSTSRDSGRMSEVEIILRDFDVYFRLRRLYSLVYLLYDLLYGKKTPGPTEAERTELEQLWHAINRQIELLEIVRARLERLVDEIDVKWEERFRRCEERWKEGQIASREEADAEAAHEIWGVVGAAMRHLLNTEGKAGQKVMEDFKQRSPETPKQKSDHLTAVNEALKVMASEARKKVETGEFDNYFPLVKSILSLTDEHERTLLDKLLVSRTQAQTPGGASASHRSLGDVVRESYDQFEALDEVMLPIELIGDLHEKDPIETIRISPADANKGFSDKGLSDKVAGDALYHFASFFKRSWRSNDILWGRLDGSCQIVETLLTAAKLRETAGSPAGRKRLRGFFFDAEGRWIAEMRSAWLFPNAGRKTQDELEDWIENLLSDDEGKRQSALAEEAFGEQIKLLIEAAQLEILHDDVPSVVSDALEEQTLWNQFRISPVKPGGTLAQRAAADASADLFSFQPGGGTIDHFVGSVAAAAQSFNWAEQLKDDNTAPRPRATKLGKLFRHHYRVGTEELLRDLPLLVLLEILAVALLVLRNCILNIFGPNARKVKKNLLFFFGVDLPLRTFYGAVLFLRRAPQAWVALQFGLAVLALLTLLVGINWRNEILFTPTSQGPQLQLKWFAVFIALPLLVLVGQGVFVWRGRIGKWRGAPVLQATLIGALLVAPLLALILTFQTLSHLVIRNAATLYEVARQAVAGALGVPGLVAHVITGMAVAGSFLGVALGLWWLNRMGRTQPLNEDELRYALENYFSLEKLTLLARRYFSLDPKALEEWVKPAQTMTWKKLKHELAKTLPPDQVRMLGEKLQAGPDQPVAWEDVRRQLKALGQLDDIGLDMLANQIGITRSVASHLIAQARQQQMQVQSGRKLRDRLAVAKQAAYQLLAQARQQDTFARLEREIRAINPEVLR